MLHALLMCIIVVSSQDSVEEILVEFKNSLSNASALDSWNKDVPICSDSKYWIGLICVKAGFWGFKIDSMGLSGALNVEPLTKLSTLFMLSFENNTFVGPFPSNINKIPNLFYLSLSNNKFSGEIPGDAFKGTNISTLYLGNNDFTGKIPKSLAGLSTLDDLQLQNNKFEGGIPDFKQKDLVANFAYNKLEGPIPASLSDEPPSCFAGKFL